MKTYRMFSDASHGWLEVPITEVLASKAFITTCSYVDKQRGRAYLEEDCDAPAFLKAAGLSAPGMVRLVDVHQGDSSAIRNLPSYGGIWS